VGRVTTRRQEVDGRLITRQCFHFAGCRQKVRALGELLDVDTDAGAETIQFHLAQRHSQVPWVSTIWRVFKTRGFVTPSRRRPDSPTSANSRSRGVQPAAADAASRAW
jgi:hypothetical protein